jgi:hypothetical protein
LTLSDDILQVSLRAVLHVQFRLIGSPTVINILDDIGMIQSRQDSIFSLRVLDRDFALSETNDLAGEKLSPKLSYQAAIAGVRPELSVKD